MTRALKELFITSCGTSTGATRYDQLRDLVPHIGQDDVRYEVRQKGGVQITEETIYDLAALPEEAWSRGYRAYHDIGGSHLRVILSEHGLAQIQHAIEIYELFTIGTSGASPEPGQDVLPLVSS